MISRYKNPSRPQQCLPVETFDEQKKRARAVLRQMNKSFPSPRCTLEYRTPFQLLTSVLLSAQCTDKRVNMVTPELFRCFPTPEKMAAAPLERIEELIRSTGFFRNQAKNLKALSAVIVKNHAGEVPRTIEELTALPGIGRKTALCILGNAFDESAGFVVDTHVGRIARRLGFSCSGDPVRVEKDLCALFPKGQWIDLSHRFIQLGRSSCRAPKPHCDGCPLEKYCPKLPGKPART